MLPLPSVCRVQTSLMRKISCFILGAALLTVTGCENNVGSIFDPDKGGGGGAGDGTNIQALPVGGIAVDGRPRITDVFPEGDGWPSAVPIVVVFNESMNEESIVPAASTALPPTLFLRLAGTDQPLPADYDFLLAGTVVLMRPLVPLADLTSYEVVIDPEARDADAVRVGGNLRVIAEFTVDEDPAEADGRILTTLPVDNSRDRLRESPVYTVFNKPANVTSVTTSNFRMETSAGTPIGGNISFPLEITQGLADGRLLRFDPSASLDANTDQEIFYENSITFPGTPEGRLQFGNRSPYAEFRTQDVEQPDGVVVGNISPGFPDKINIQNIANLMVDVTMPASTFAGDTVVVRIYGLEPQTDDSSDVNFVERSATAVAAGAQTVSVDMTSTLGSAAAPRFDDGAVTITARQTRGSRSSGVIHSPAASSPLLDVTLPTLVSIGPPTGINSGDMVTDLQHLSLYGTASEELGGAVLTGMGPVSGTANLFAGAADGSFIIAPLFLGRLTTAVSASLELTDASGNATTAMPLPGMIIQRGVVTGSVTTGMSLTVEAYDESTLQALSGVTVLLDAASPDPSGLGQIAQVTGANGQTTFTGLVNSSHSVTLVAPGYELFSLVNSSAGFASLPLRPQAAATGSLDASILFPPIPGQSAIVGINLLDDVTEEAVVTSSSNPNSLPATAVRPNRPIVITAYSGVIEPVGLPSFNNFTCQMCGPLGLTPSPPAPPIDPGGSGSETLALVPASASAINLASSYSKDFAQSTGLGMISGSPTVRVVASLFGMSGMSLFGLGFSTAGAGMVYTVDASYSLNTILGLASFQPVLWVSTEARDAAGNIARHRRLVSSPTTGGTVLTTATPGIPSISAPAGPASAPPLVDFADRLDPATAITVGGFGFHQVTARDALGRSWTMITEDLDGIGVESLQYPLIQAPLVGLAAGTWTVNVETFLGFSSTFGSADYILEERFRQMVTYARAVSVDYTVN